MERERDTTAQWIHAILEFLKSWQHLIDAHLVNFFKDTLWDSIDPLWLRCLQAEPVHALLAIPSGAAPDHWPHSLTTFINDLNALSYPRQTLQSSLQLPKLVCQGMAPKKQHEVQSLCALVASLANSIGAQTIIDVGAGQGYVSQALSFHYNLPNVLAVDSSSHHATVTQQRSHRIARHYKLTSTSNPNALPKTITCHIDSVQALTHLIATSTPRQSNVLLLGLHACGDLSVTMLKTFLECQQVKAVVSIGCCYNLLSEEQGNNSAFPLSRFLTSKGFSLGKNSRDLACQSAERWKCLPTQDGINNFELHAFRAAFQMVLEKFYPQVMMTSPSIGRQGKALRRQQKKGITESDDLCSLFTRYCNSGLTRLGLATLEDSEYQKVWNQVEPYLVLIGPYCSLRAALGPLLETLILLDRLLFLQEHQQHSIQPRMFPIFDPYISPRNIAIVAQKSKD